MVVMELIGMLYIKMKQKLILIFFSLIFLFNFISAITLQENTQFQPSATNTTFIMGNNLSFDLVEVHSTYLKLDNNTISVNSSAGSVNITIFNFTDSYKKFNETASDSSATISYVVSNFTSGVSVLATKNNVAWQAVIANSTGYVSFDYSGSAVLFELELGAMPVTETTSSQGGGGSVTYFPSLEQLKKGYEKTLKKNYKIKFKFNNESYQLKLDKITDETATITVSSEPITFNLSVNETKKIDLNDDGFYDLQIFLKDITGFSYWKKADLVVKLISEGIIFEEKIGEVVEEQEEEVEILEKKSNLWLWIVIGLVVLIVVGVVIRIKKRRRKKYFEF